jgi:hypothetical protein
MLRTFTIAAALVVLLSPGAVLGENIVRLRDSVVVESGHQVDIAVAVGGDVHVYGSVRKDAVALGGSVFLGPQAVVGGNVVSFGGGVTQQEGARVDGQTTVFDIPGVRSLFRYSLWDRWHWPYRFPSLPGYVPFLGFLALTLLVVVLMPGIVGSISATVEQGPVASFFWGLLGTASILPIAFLLVISLIGIVFIPLQMLLVGVGLFLGYVSVVQLLGRKIFRSAGLEDKPMIAETLLGMVVFWLVSQAPFVGWLFATIAVIVGFGGVIAALFRRILHGRPPEQPAQG